MFLTFTLLLGLPFSPKASQAAGFVHSVVPSDQLLAASIKLAKRVPAIGYDAYAVLKRYAMGVRLTRPPPQLASL